jgi:hypothetical protein
MGLNAIANRETYKVVREKSTRSWAVISKGDNRAPKRKVGYTKSSHLGIPLFGSSLWERQAQRSDPLEIATNNRQSDRYCECAARSLPSSIPTGIKRLNTPPDSLPFTSWPLVSESRDSFALESLSFSAFWSLSPYRRCLRSILLVRIMVLSLQALLGLMRYPSFG